MEQLAFKNVNNCLITNIYSYFETSAGKSCNLYLNVVHFSTPVIIRHLWKLKTTVFLHWCLIHAILLLFPLFLSSKLFLFSFLDLPSTGSNLNFVKCVFPLGHNLVSYAFLFDTLVPHITMKRVKVSSKHI
jgi:hypothetical protein